MTKEKIEKKLEEIKRQQEQTLANLHAMQGAEQVLIQLLQEMSETNGKKDSN